MENSFIVTSDVYEINLLQFHNLFITSTFDWTHSLNDQINLNNLCV